MTPPTKDETIHKWRLYEIFLTFPADIYFIIKNILRKNAASKFKEFSLLSKFYSSLVARFFISLIVINTHKEKTKGYENFLLKIFHTLN